MSDRRMSRRNLMAAMGLLVFAAPLLQACQSSSPSGTSSQAAPTTAPATTSQSPAQPTTAPNAAAAPSGAKVAMSVAVWTDPVRTWMTKFAKDWAAKNPNVALTIDSINYADMPKKQLTEFATHTLQDLTFNTVKWIDYPIYKGLFQPIDSYVKTKDPGLDDFIPVAITSGKYNGKLYALPSEVNTGNQNIFFYNEDLLSAKGVTPPTDDWTLDDLLKLAVQLTDPSKQVWGTDYFPSGTYYDFGALLLGNGGQILSDDGTKFLFSDAKSVPMVKWATEIRTKSKAAPSRAESQASLFPAGRIALHADGVQGIIAAKKTIGDKFKFTAILGPTGPQGRRGFDSFVLNWAIASGSKAPDQAYDLMSYYTAHDQQLWSFVNQGQPPTRKSIWSSPEADKISPVWGRALKWIANGIDKGPFPEPANFRYQELEDKWENVAYGVFYGEVPLEDGIQKVQQACQAILDEPKP